MTDRELRNLSRAKLLEILISLSKENEALREQTKQLGEELNSRRLAISSAGSIAEAALSVNGVFEAAQRASEQYIENIKNMEAECAAIRAKAEAEAETIVAQARSTADEIIENAKRETKHYLEEVSFQLVRFSDENKKKRNTSKKSARK